MSVWLPLVSLVVRLTKDSPFRTLRSCVPGPTGVAVRRPYVSLYYPDELPRRMEWVNPSHSLCPRIVKGTTSLSTYKSGSRTSTLPVDRVHEVVVKSSSRVPAFVETSLFRCKTLTRLPVLIPTRLSVSRLLQCQELLVGVGSQVTVH